MHCVTVDGCPYRAPVTLAVPQIRPENTELAGEASNGGNGDADNGGWVARDVVDERRAEAVDGECTRHLKWLCARYVRRDFVVREVGREGHFGASDGAGCGNRNAICDLNQPMAGVQGAGAAPLSVPSRRCSLGRVGLAKNLLVKHEGGIPAENERILSVGRSGDARDNRLSLCSCEKKHHF